MKCLLIYYSLTGQAERAVRVAADACRTAGWEPVLCRIDFEDTGQRLQRPLSIAALKTWTADAANGVTAPIVYTPESALRDRYDAMLIFSNTWQKHPSIPIRRSLFGFKLPPYGLSQEALAAITPFTHSLLAKVTPQNA